MNECPHCGAELPSGAIFCRHCQRSLVNTSFSGLATPLSSLLMALILLLLVFLTGMALLDLVPLFKYVLVVYAALVIAFLSILGARGRYGYPGWKGYLVTFLIALVPIVGTLYVAYFAGGYLFQFRVIRYSLVVLMVVVTGLLAFSKADLTAYAGLFPTSATPTEASPSPTAVPTRQPSAPTATENPTQTPAPAVVEVSDPSGSDCLLWSQISAQFVGEKVCVYGDYTDIFQKQDGAWVMAFSDEPGAFQLWSSPKPMAMYVERIEGKCVRAYGYVQETGVRQIIILKRSDVLDACPVNDG